ncbi:MAG TPA: HAMP domain-containing sensor histidine kinase [Chloroflexota bacterium]|nr:HAMP domain-containing sensor histidine kinase [Chloroflexota bacterium]
MDISRLESSKLRLEREAFDLVELAKDVTASLQPLTTEFTLRVQTPAPVRVWADRLRLEQVMTNLVSNATRYAGKGDHIDVEIGVLPMEQSGRGSVAGSAGQRETTAAVTLAVRDYGVGIAPEYRERIFERFYQMGAASRAGGLGLGLYVTQQIVQLHGGAIAVECPPDGGTRFIVTLPASAQPVLAATPAAASVVTTEPRETAPAAALVNVG